MISVIKNDKEEVNMMLAILNWVLLAFLAVSNAALIRIMFSRTGRCSIRNCMNCPYAVECPAQRRTDK